MSTSSDITHSLRVAQNLSQKRKYEYLNELTETDFRDKVLRAVFSRQGLVFRRDLCGPEEEGKDCIFTDTDKLGQQVIYAVQTKRGDISMGASESKSYRSLINQLNDALETTIDMPSEKISRQPDVVYLVASGKLSNKARRRVVEELSDPRLRVLDFEELVPLIDKHYPEFWANIDANRNPYLKALQGHILSNADTLEIFENDSDTPLTPINDGVYVPTYLKRYKPRIRRRKGEVFRDAEVESFPALKIPERNERLILITGPGGAGKSTALRKLAYDIADEILFRDKDLPIPIFISAKTAQKFPSLYEAAITETRTISGSTEAAITTTDADNGNILFLVDALDEVPEDNRSALVQKILSHKATYPKCQIVVTSRDYGSITNLDELSSFVKFSIDAMRLDHASRLIHQIAVMRSVSEDRCKETLRQLQDVHGVELNPMLVTVFLATSDVNRKDIPPNITEIFSKYTELMLGRWDEKKGLKHQYESRVKEHLLSQLALLMHQNNAVACDKHGVAQFSEKLLETLGYEETGDKLYEEVVDRSGLLVTHDGQVAFRHHMLQEYFAGRAISNDDMPGLVGHEWWRMPIVFACGNRPNEIPKIASILKSVRRKDPLKQFEASVTLGLATQACYLTPTKDKITALRSVVDMLAISFPGLLDALSKHSPQNMKLLPFMSAYLQGRSAVGTNIIKDIIDDTWESTPDLLYDDNVDEVRRFWILAGLVEAEEYELLEESLKGYNPKDRRLLLGIFLGLAFAADGRHASKKNKKLASKLMDQTKGRVASELKQLSDEFSGFVLEAQQDRVKVLDNADNASHPLLTANESGK